jgi:hypothetical protein
MKKKTAVYAVFWPDINVFKIGITNRKRWGSFVSRGAKLLATLDNFENGSQALDFERACHIVSSEVCRPAFTSSAEATPYLGNGGGGYLECFRVPGDLMPSEILRFIDSRLAVFHAQA